MLIGGGYWYVRNLIVSGNPFPWQDIGPIHHAEALQGRHPYSIVHYATDTSVWGRYFTPALHERLGELWPAYLGAGRDRGAARPLARAAGWSGCSRWSPWSPRSPTC